MIRGLGLRGAIAVNVITMIGIGPLITIPLVLANLHGSIALAAWIGGALIALCDGLIWAELASQFPGSGGTYVYLLETFGRQRSGRLFAFLFTWQTVLSLPLILATGYIGFAQYAAYLWPVLASDAHAQGIVAAAVGILTLALLYRPIGAVGATSFAFAAIAIATLGAIIAAASAHLNVAQALSFDHSASLGPALLAGLGPALVITLYDYYGYAQSCLLGDEVRAPARVLPRSIVISVIGIALLYIALQLGVLGVVRWQELVPATPGGAAPAAANFVASTVLERTWGIWAARIGTVAILVTAFASTFGNLLGGSRIPYAAAVDGVFLRPFAALERRGRFPHVALLTLGLLALPACFFKLGDVIAALTAATVVIQNLAQVAILFVLRARGVVAPYRMWLYPVPALLAGAGWVYIFFSAGLGPIAYGLLTLGAGVALYFVRARLRSEWPFALKAAGTLGVAFVVLLALVRPAAAAWGSSAIVERRGVPIFTVAGKPFFVYGAAFFYERLPRDRWEPSMRSLRALGINTLDLYVPWNWHELSDGQFDFDGHTSPRRDLREVLRLARVFGFHIVLRPGPVIRNEWRNGGYPAWLLQRPEYGMPLHDLLEGRYPPTATLQNAHSDDAAQEWLTNATHLYYAKRWLERALHEFDADSGLVIAVALDDDQGAYLDNQTWPAPHLTAYLRWLESVVHGVTGPLEPVFINTYQMKVTASSPVWAMGNWYQSDAYELGEHDRAQLEFSTGLLQTRPHQPLMLSEFQAGWLLQPGDIRPRPADPSNTLLAMSTLLGMGVRGLVNFPAQDTLYPAGMEAPFANSFYAWDAALQLDGTPAPRAVPTAAFGHFIARFGRSLAASEPVADLAIAYTVDAYGDTPPSDADVGLITNRTLEVQQACRALSLTCRLVDLRYSSDAELAAYRVIVIPAWQNPNGRLPSFVSSVAEKLKRFHSIGGHTAVIGAGRDRSDLHAALLASGIDPVVLNAPGATFARSHDGQLDGYLFMPNYNHLPLALRNVVVRIDRKRRVVLRNLLIPARDVVISPIGLRSSDGRRLLYTDCPLQAWLEAQPAGTSDSPSGTCRLEYDSGSSVLLARPGPSLPMPQARALDALPVRVDAILPPAPYGPYRAPLAADLATVEHRDVYRDGDDTVVLENALVRIVLESEAGARAFIFEDLATRANVFTSVGALRDDVFPEPPLSSTDRIAKYTHDFPAGMFNRHYGVVSEFQDATRATVVFSYTAPDVTRPGSVKGLQRATFTRSVSLAPGARTFSVDENVVFSDNERTATPVAAVSVCSLALGSALDMHTTLLLTPNPEPFVAHAERRIAGTAFGYYDDAAHQLATIAWRPKTIAQAEVLEQEHSVVARLTLAPNVTSHVEYGFFIAPSLDAARAMLGKAAETAAASPIGARPLAQGQAPTPANSAR